MAQKSSTLVLVYMFLWQCFDCIDGSQAKVTLRKGSRTFFLRNYTNLAQFAYTSFALFLPASSFMRRQARVDTLDMNALLRFGNFFKFEHVHGHLQKITGNTKFSF